jgi:hypothetical protein
VTYLRGPRVLKPAWPLHQKRSGALRIDHALLAPGTPERSAGNFRWQGGPVAGANGRGDAGVLEW